MMIFIDGKMKKVCSFSLSVIFVLLTFSACGLNRNAEAVKIQNEEYFSMYRCNEMILENDFQIFSPFKASDEKYYFVDCNNYLDLFCLSQTQFAKLCNEKSFCEFDEQGYYYSYVEPVYSFSDNDYDYIEYVQVYKDYIYVLLDSDCSTIYRINCKDKNDSSVVYKSNHIKGFFFYNDEIYIITVDYNFNFAIEKSSLNGSNSITVVNGGSGFENARDDEIYNVYISNDYLYFVLRENGFESNMFLYCRCKTDGTEKTVWNSCEGCAGFTANEDYVMTLKYTSEADGDVGEGLVLNKYDAKSLKWIQTGFHYPDKDTILMTEEDMALIYPVFYNGRNIEINISAEGYSNMTFERNIVGNETYTKKGTGFIVKSCFDETFILNQMETDTGWKIYFEKITEW